MGHQIIWPKIQGKLRGDLPSVTQGSTLETLTIGAFYSDGTGVSLTGKTITATATDEAGNTTSITGTLTGGASQFTWALSEGDIGTDGIYTLIVTYTDGVKSWASDPARFTVLPNPAADSVQNPALVGIGANDAAWVAAGSAGGALGGAAYEDTTAFDAAGSAAAAQAAAEAYADGLVAYQGAKTRDFTVDDLATNGEYGYRTDQYQLQLRANDSIIAQRLNTYAINRALGVKRENMIAFWPMREQTGSFAEDYTGRGNHGLIIAGSVLGAAGPGDGSAAIDTTTGGVNVYSAQFAAAFNPAEFSIRLVFAADLWNALRSVLYFSVDANNYVAVQINTPNRLVLIYRAGGTSKTIDSYPISSTVAPDGFIDMVLTVSKANDRMIAYINGAQFSTTQTGLGTWTGTFAANSANIGCFLSTPTFSLAGQVSFSQVWTTELTAAQVQSLMFGVIVGFGDSVTAGTGATTTSNRWLNKTATGMGRTVVVNAGLVSTVLQNTTQNTVTTIGGAASNNGRDTYTARVLAYNPEYVFILYGLNDLRLNDAAFTAANYQNDLGEVVDALKTAGVAAQKIVIGSPPYIPEASYALGSPYNGGSLVKHAQYVAAAAAVATAKGTKYIDVYQWMADNGGATLISGDNIHPNDAGHDAIADAFLSVL